MTAWRDIRGGTAEIRLAAAPRVRAVLDALGRTEDARFSPDGSRLAVVAFNRNRIAVFDLDLSRDESGAQVNLTGVVEIVSPALRRPHGLDFISADLLVVANREGDAVTFAVPRGSAEGVVYDLAPVQVLPAGKSDLLRAPGSVAVTRGGAQGREILICNNAANHVTRHALDGATIGAGEVLLRKWLDVPDSVTISADRRWIAISNHNTHGVLLYENTPVLGPAAEPDGLLRGVHYPHGLRFGRDGGHILLADAGAPYVHVYAADPDGVWRGPRGPALSFRVMDDALFERGRTSPQDGGPKGLDLDADRNLLVITSECQPLAFFDLATILERLPASARDLREQQALQIRSELEVAAESRRAQLHAEAKAARARAKLAVVKGSLSWRLAKPVRWLQAIFRRRSD